MCSTYSVLNPQIELPTGHRTKSVRNLRKTLSVRAANLAWLLLYSLHSGGDVTGIQEPTGSFHYSQIKTAASELLHHQKIMTDVLNSWLFLQEGEWVQKWCEGLQQGGHISKTSLALAWEVKIFNVHSQELENVRLSSFSPVRPKPSKIPYVLLS